MSLQTERTVPERVLVSTGVNVSSLDRAASLALATLFAVGAYRDRRSPFRAGVFILGSVALFRRALTGHSRLYSSIGFATAPEEFLPLASTSFIAVHEPQRTVTILASLAEIEMFFADPPRLAGYELSRDFEVSFTFRSAPHAGTEVQARLQTWPNELSRSDADRLLRDFLREAKQLIETGEVARIDNRVRGSRASGVSTSSAAVTSSPGSSSESPSDSSPGSGAS